MSGKIACFTSITFSYLDRARVLARSVRRFHPDWWFIVMITDRPPDQLDFPMRPEDDFDEIIWPEDLGISDLRAWMFGHDIVEICTAVKGPVLLSLTCRDFSKIVYLDPDTCLFNDLDPVLTLLESYDIVLTPHQLEPDSSRHAITDNEICSLKTGIYNLGFLAVRCSDEGKRFAQWWNDRLLSFCFDDIPNGLFVDQRWCDLIPSFFDKVAILRDPGYNVASWNLSQRRITIRDCGGIFVNSSPLRFWHFTKLGPIGDVMTDRYAKDNFEVHEIWRWYKEQIRLSQPASLPERWWYYGAFENGEAIPREVRHLYRGRTDLQIAFADPYAYGEGTFRFWLANENVLPFSD